jgi:hypothetical protein
MTKYLSLGAVYPDLYVVESILLLPHNQGDIKHKALLGSTPTQEWSAGKRPEIL